jgi:hypothetical protein
MNNSVTKWIPVVVTASTTVLTAVFSPTFITAHPLAFAVANGFAQLLHSVLPSTMSSSTPEAK